MSEAEKFKLVAKDDGGWTPWCSVCKRQVDGVHIARGLEKVHDGAGNLICMRGTGVDLYNFHCHGEQACFELDRRDPDHVSVRRVGIVG